MNKLLKIAGIATLVAVVGVVAVGAVAFAQEPPWNPPFPSKMPFHGPFGGTRGHGIDGPLGMSAEQARAYWGQMVEAFAEALGTSAEDLKAAIARGQTPCEIIEAQGLDVAKVWDATVSARQELLQQAVEDKFLTQRQADWISGRMADHNPGDWCEDGGPLSFVGKMRTHRPFGGQRGYTPVDFEEAQVYREQIGGAFAEALGISLEELEGALAEGQTACEIIEAQGLDAAEVWDATASARRQLLQQAVEDELLTQQQADWIGERMADHNPDAWCEEGGPVHSGWPAHSAWPVPHALRGFPPQPDTSSH